MSESRNIRRPVELDDHAFERRLGERQLENFLRLIGVGQYTEAAAAVAYAASMALESSWTAPRLWLLVTLVAILVRAAAIHLARHDEGWRIPARLTFLTATNTACGMMWGLSAVLLTSGGPQSLMFITVVWLTGAMVASLCLIALTSNMPLWWGVPLLAGLLGTLVTSQQAINLLMAFGVLLMLVFVSVLVFLTRVSARRDFRRQLINEELVDALSEERRRADALNESLREEIERRRGVEQQLMADKANAERLSTIDGLTGIFNRRAFDEALSVELRRARRDGSTVSLILADVDHFKEYNDLYGHIAGDDVLTRIAQLMKSMTRRSSDLAYRIGGEEFAVLLPRTDHDHALNIARNICDAVRDEQVEHGATQPGVVTLSLGVASIRPENDVAGEQLMLAADRALYKSKSDGRNRVCSAQDLGVVAEVPAAYAPHADELGKARR